jgi:hypothetical protein
MAKEGDSPVIERAQTLESIPSTTGHEKPVGNPGGPPSKAKYADWPIVNKYREGKVKRTPWGEWNRIWNRKLTSSGSTMYLVHVWPRAFCIMSQWVIFAGKVKPLGVAVAKASLNRAFSLQQ